MNKQEYKCLVCYKIYQHSSGLRKHKAKNICAKTEIVQKESELKATVQKLLEENFKKEEVIKVKEKETKKLLEEKEQEIKKILEEKEIKQLKSLIELIVAIKDKVDENNREIKEKINSVANKINSNSTTNYNLTQNLTHNNDNENINVNIELSKTI